MNQPRYLIIGGEVFDRVVSASPEIQKKFLRVVVELRHSPRSSGVVSIEQARGWGVLDAFIAEYDGVSVSYQVVEEERKGWVFLIEILWV